VLLFWPSRATTAVVLLATCSQLLLLVMLSNIVAKLAVLASLYCGWFVCVVAGVSTEVVRTGRRSMLLGLSARKRSCASASNSWASGGSGGGGGRDNRCGLLAVLLLLAVVVLVDCWAASTSAAAVLSVVGTLDWLILCVRMCVRCSIECKPSRAKKGVVGRGGYWWKRRVVSLSPTIVGCGVYSGDNHSCTKDVIAPLSAIAFASNKWFVCCESPPLWSMGDSGLLQRDSE
jgi:hypothetical protein